MAAEDRNILAICLTAAFVFWLILNLSENYEITREVEISYQVDPERALVGQVPTRMNVRVAGSGWSLIWESLRMGTIPLTIEVGSAESLRLTGNEISLEVNRRLSSNDLHTNELDFEPLVLLTTPREGKRVPIVSNIRSRFAPGYLATAPPVFEPDSVTVSGAIDELESIEEWPTEELELRQVDGDIRRSVRLQPPGPGLTLTREEVNYALEVEPFIERTLTVPVTVVNASPTDSFRLNPSEVELRVSIPQGAYEAVGPEDFLLEADLARVRKGSGGNQVLLTLTRQPDAVISVFFTPLSVEYYLLGKTRVRE
ncbi:YbbR-like domain-containing protein [Neolewinella lacunae]|uniref:YbbR-like domain-containing protein n=1 Tax=Neolewinella lacunae TaxID=1517758 RepID=A0A923PP54_9BACT|nr:YbbR-like domain-containing protein [Neolewinella lacunae]MBC6995236.1 YbbR-like domain-containing protein [Neolewinella lacunae]MDN3635455.1 YbbR-like domain-containing protein [Neolewinella lacunae]